MIGWTEQQQMVRGMFRDFVEKEIVPHIEKWVPGLSQSPIRAQMPLAL